MEFLSREGVPFTHKNIREDPAALAELIQIGSQQTPTIVVDDEVVMGFDAERLRELIGSLGE